MAEEMVLVERLKGNGRALYACACGGHKVLYVRNVRHGLSKHCGDRAMHPDPRVKSDDEITNRAAHKRMTAAFGPASAKPCAVCGVVGEGNQYAYRHGDPDQRADEAGKDAGQMFSTDPRHYWILCKPHHRRWDAGHRRFTPKGGLSGLHVALQLLSEDD